MDFRESNREKEFKIMFQEHFTSMCILAGKFLGDHEAARDAVHDVFIKLWEANKGTANMAYPKSYLYTAVRNYCLDLIRKEKHLPKEIYGELPDEKESNDFFETEVLREEVYQLLNRAIQSLPERSQAIIKLKVAGKKNQEIAEILNISVNTVNTLKTHAYETLRELLKDRYMIFWLLFSSALSIGHSENSRITHPQSANITDWQLK